jgi:hypothetical protein
MFCPKCGAENPEGSSFCNSCGESLAMPGQSAAPNPPAFQGRPVQQGQVEHVPNYMVWSIISIFLCWIFAIPAIVNSVRVDDALAAGDVARARFASGKAKFWATVATVIGLIGYVSVAITGLVRFLF